MSQYKIIFTGPVGAGKTTAIHSISDIPPVKTDAAASDMTKSRKAATTVAMDYGVMNLTDGEKNSFVRNAGAGAFRLYVGYSDQRRHWFGSAAG